MTTESLTTIVRTLAEKLRQSKRVAVLTGAGISAESGIPTFRSGANALWNNRKPEDLATLAAFARDPELVTEWYVMRLRLVQGALPNPGHNALAEFERRFAARSASFSVLTQNVDGLHQAAGSNDVCELHGSIRKWRCVGCAAERHLTADFSTDARGLIGCGCGSVMRPGVVWFGEALPTRAWASAEAAASRAQVFIVAGTSAAVYPAAGLVATAKQVGAFIVEVNPESTEVSSLCDLVVRAPSGEFLPLLLAGR